MRLSQLALQVNAQTDTCVIASFRAWPTYIAVISSLMEHSRAPTVWWTAGSSSKSQTLACTTCEGAKISPRRTPTHIIEVSTEYSSHRWGLQLQYTKVTDGQKFSTGFIGTRALTVHKITNGILFFFNIFISLKSIVVFHNTLLIVPCVGG